MRVLVEKCLDISTDMGKPFGEKRAKQARKAGVSLVEGESRRGFLFSVMIALMALVSWRVFHR